MTRLPARGRPACCCWPWPPGAGPGARAPGRRPPTDAPPCPTLTADPAAAAGAADRPALADLRQSSRDAALGRMEVWIGNDTRHDVTPTRIRYTDPRFRAPVAGERLRLNPSRSERGYPLALPAVPACGRHRGPGRARA